MSTYYFVSYTKHIKANGTWLFQSAIVKDKHPIIFVSELPQKDKLNITLPNDVSVAIDTGIYYNILFFNEVPEEIFNNFHKILAPGPRKMQ